MQTKGLAKGKTKILRKHLVLLVLSADVSRVSFSRGEARQQDHGDSRYVFCLAILALPSATCAASPPRSHLPGRRKGKECGGRKEGEGEEGEGERREIERVRKRERGKEKEIE